MFTITTLMEEVKLHWTINNLCYTKECPKSTNFSQQIDCQCDIFFVSLIHTKKIPPKAVGRLNAEIVIPLRYRGANSFSEGLAMVAKRGKWGFLDKSGNLLSPQR